MLLAGAGLTLLVSAARPAEIGLTVSGQRTPRGVLQVCLTRDPANFPDCNDDEHALKRTVPAAQGQLAFHGMPSGAYAIAVFHDENSNTRLDTILGVPREGFGFSRNPPLGFGPPRFAAARFTVTSGEATTGVKLKYLL